MNRRGVFHGRFIFLILLLPFLPSLGESRTLQGKVIKVFDGDTFLVRIQGRKEHVRLREIDAPEMTHRKQVGQEPWASRARDYASSKAQGKAVTLVVEEKDEVDKYHRLLAYIFIDGLFLNREMVRSGYAFFYPGPFRGKFYADLRKAEEKAKKAGLGVWDRNQGLKERPQEFRSRTQRDETLFSPFRRRSNLPGSPGVARVSPRNRVDFKSPAEAEKNAARMKPGKILISTERAYC